LPLEINYKERMVEILYTRLLYPHLCTCFKLGSDFQRHMSWVFFMYNELKWEVIVRFVDFGANCCSSLFRTEWPVCTTYAFTSLYNICIHPFVQHMYSPVYTTYVFTSLYNICIHQFVQHIYSPVCTTYVFTSLYNICIHQFVQHMYSPVCTTYVFMRFALVQWCNGKCSFIECIDPRSCQTKRLHILNIVSPYLKWHCIFSFLRRFFLSSLTANTFTGLDCICE
jgi:hypothetical protein